MISPCDQIHNEMGELFECSQEGEWIKIRTPYLYPDGDFIELYLKGEGDNCKITDLGETLRWLRMQTVTKQRSAKQDRFIQDICLTLDVEFYKGMLILRMGKYGSVAEALTRLSQAAIRVADLWFTLRGGLTESIMDDVDELLKENKIPFERSVSLVGRSNKSWKIDFKTRHRNRSSLIKVLSTGSRSAGQTAITRALSTWVDLSHLKIGPSALQFVSLFDDTVDIWTEEDIRLLEEFSEVSFWSRPDELISRLTNNNASEEIRTRPV